MECLTVSSIRHLITLQWNLKVKDILPDLTAQELGYSLEKPEKIVRSVQCRIKSMDDPIFYLALTNQLNVLAKDHSIGSHQILYAFAVVENRAFLVKYSDKFKFLDFLQRDHLDSAKEVSFHCLVLVGSPVTDSTSPILDLANINEGLSTEGQGYVDIEVTEHHYKFDDEIPDFTVEKAKEWIVKESTNEVLKVLAMEYLMKFIEAENVSDILKIAIDQDIKVLQKQCSEFLSECTIRHYDSSSSSSSD